MGERERERERDQPRLQSSSLLSPLTGGTVDKALAVILQGFSVPV